MKTKTSVIALMLALLLCTAVPLAAKPDKYGAAHKAAIKKCQEDYREATKAANEGYKSAVKSAKGQTGKGKAESLAHARQAQAHALAVANMRKTECVKNAPK
jgi:vacuolar-type H+-ATPase subunit H